jgi:GNAT superfamily N-acetyltransferase
MPCKAVTIIPAQAEDVAALQATAAACWWATYRALLPAEFIEKFLARAYNERVLLKEIAATQSRFLVAKHGDALIGFGQVGPSLPRRDLAPVAPADLHRLYLLPQWQRQGIGAQLLGELEGWLRAQGHAYYGAYVLASNAPAKHFYLRQGFTHKPECDVQDEWYLVKQLGG